MSVILGMTFTFISARYMHLGILKFLKKYDIKIHVLFVLDIHSTIYPKPSCDSNGNICFNVLVHLHCVYTDIKDMYDMFDLNGSGALSFRELRKGLQILGLNPTITETRAILKKHNVEGSK